MTVNELEKRIDGARNILPIPAKERLINVSNTRIQSRMNVGYSGHADFADYPNAKDLALYVISAGVIGLAMGAVYALFEFIS